MQILSPLFLTAAQHVFPCPYNNPSTFPLRQVFQMDHLQYLLKHPLLYPSLLIKLVCKVGIWIRVNNLIEQVWPLVNNKDILPTIIQLGGWLLYLGVLAVKHVARIPWCDMHTTVNINYHGILCTSMGQGLQKARVVSMYSHHQMIWHALHSMEADSIIIKPLKNTSTFGTKINICF